MARTPSEDQREYNSMLDVTQSMLGKIADAMNDVSAKSDKRNKKLAEQLSLTNDIIKSIQTEEDLESALELIRENNVKLSEQDFGINNKLKDTFEQQATALEGIVNAHKNSNKILEFVNESADELTNKFDGALDGFLSDIESIPIIGKPLANLMTPLKEKMSEGFSKVTGDFKGGFMKSFAEARASGMSFAKSVTSGLGGGLKAAGSAARALAGTFAGTLIIAYALYKAIEIGIERFKELDAAAKVYREETGLLVSQTGQMFRNIQKVNGEYANLGASADDVAKAAAEFTNEFGGIEQPSRQVLGSMVALNKSFGISTKEASQLNKVFQNIGGLTATQSQALIGQTAEMAKMAGVAPNQVIKDMAENSEYAYRYFQGSPDKLAKAAVQAAKLGTSLKEAGKTADTLLDFENSITKELEASAILGTNLNLGQARYLAATGDILGAQQATVDEVSKLGDITKLNKWQQDALVEATGMEFDSLVNQQRIREKFGKLSDKQLESANALVASGRDLSKLTEADLAAQTKRLAMQNDMQSVADSLSNEWSAMGTALYDMLAPLGELVMPILRDVSHWVGAVLVPIFKLVGNLLGIVVKIIMPIWNVLSAIVGGVFDVVGSIIGVIADGFGFINDLLAQMGDWINKNIVSPIQSFFQSITGFFSGISSVLGFGGGEEDSGSTQTQSINDGVVQNGKVVSTHPDDFLIATKTPETLGQTGGNGTISMDGVIQELRALKDAFLSNKDVYIDRERVTSVIRTQTNRTSDNKFGVVNA